MGFPFSYLTLAISFLVGVGITLATVGILGIAFVFILIYSGMLKILPLLQLIQKGVQLFFPSQLKNLENSIQSSFTLEGEKSKGIYMFHPHGAFSVSYFFHTQKEKLGKAVVSKYLWAIPFGGEICESLEFIPNRYIDMKNVIEKGENLCIIPGGSLEMLIENKKELEKTKTLRIKLLNRKGIFRMALETGTPLIPCLTFGETELYELSSYFRSVHNYLKQWELILPIPSFSSLYQWSKVMNGGLETPIHTVIGNPLQVEKQINVTDQMILDLRKKYIQTLQELYSKKKPEGYAPNIIFE